MFKAARINRCFNRATSTINRSSSRFTFSNSYSTTISPIVAAKLPDLEYDYGELEPVISGEIMRLHHSKHHAAYVNNFNIAAEKLSTAEKQNDISTMISLQSALKFNGGGHVNHSIFWTNLTPIKKGGGQLASGPLADAINAEFGSLDSFISKFNTETAAVQGSGWGWLVYNKQNGKLAITTRANQDPVSVEAFLVPLLGIDVWEHAYYLQYKNVRPDYLKAIWQIVNWQNVSERFTNAKQ
eukprot:TRINITY_DN927_c0_g1_i1.p1 TRINITY_DN927_c0_g1~~TRINITY_DN927_c0_g1_i1.p1  ORF type:complete len:249 (+),score=110.00 TRINITY_DN927_c0_g1_i1:27-749(+)